MNAPPAPAPAPTPPDAPRADGILAPRTLLRAGTRLGSVAVLALPVLTWGVWTGHADGTIGARLLMAGSMGLLIGVPFALPVFAEAMARSRQPGVLRDVLLASGVIVLFLLGDAFFIVEATFADRLGTSSSFADAIQSTKQWLARPDAWLAYLDFGAVLGAILAGQAVARARRGILGSQTLAGWGLGFLIYQLTMLPDVFMREAPQHGRSLPVILSLFGGFLMFVPSFFAAIFTGITEKIADRIERRLARRREAS